MKHISQFHTFIELYVTHSFNERLMWLSFKSKLDILYKSELLNTSLFFHVIYVRHVFENSQIVDSKKNNQLV